MCIVAFLRLWGVAFCNQKFSDTLSDRFTLPVGAFSERLLAVLKQCLIMYRPLQGIITRIRIRHSEIVRGYSV